MYQNVSNAMKTLTFLPIMSHDAILDLDHIFLLWNSKCTGDCILPGFSTSKYGWSWNLYQEYHIWNDGNRWRHKLGHGVGMKFTNHQFLMTYFRWRRSTSKLQAYIAFLIWEICLSRFKMPNNFSVVSDKPRFKMAV